MKLKIPVSIFKSWRERFLSCTPTFKNASQNNSHHTLKSSSLKVISTDNFHQFRRILISQLPEKQTKSLGVVF